MNTPTKCGDGRGCPRSASCARHLRSSRGYRPPASSVEFYLIYGPECPMYVEAGVEK